MELRVKLGHSGVLVSQAASSSVCQRTTPKNIVIHWEQVLMVEGAAKGKRTAQDFIKVKFRKPVTDIKVVLIDRTKAER